MRSSPNGIRRRFIRFNQQDFIKLKIYACPDHATDELIILGRNFPNRYRLTFDGLERKFPISQTIGTLNEYSKENRERLNR